jgi:hypothetical protein
MFTQVKLAIVPASVKRKQVWQRGNQLRRADSPRGQAPCYATEAATSTTSTARCGPACRVVWEGCGQQ